MFDLDAGSQCFQFGNRLQRLVSGEENLAREKNLSLFTWFEKILRCIGDKTLLLAVFVFLAPQGTPGEIQRSTVEEDVFDVFQQVRLVGKLFNAIEPRRATQAGVVQNPILSTNKAHRLQFGDYIPAFAYAAVTPAVIPLP